MEGKREKQNCLLHCSAGGGQDGEKCGLMYFVVYFISNLSKFESKHLKDKTVKVSQKQKQFCCNSEKNHVFLPSQSFI